jgi:hypothetical protein
MRLALVDTLGAVILLSAASLPVGCVQYPSRATDLQPLIAVAGQYALTGRAVPDAPKGICSNCGAKVPPGGGFVGDGRVKVPCPECNKQAAAAPKCPCGGRGYVMRPDGSRWACDCPRSIKCQNGKCPIPVR